jgi:UDP-N-acetylglucosamine 3-dehydrogenase
MSKPRIVLVGAGRMGRNHLRVIRQSPLFELRAVVDAKAKIPDLDVPLLKGVSELASIEFDSAVVATPTTTHHEIALQVIEMGKHVLVEKPIANSEQHGRELVAAAAKKNVRLAVGHVERFNPAVRKLREVINEGWLGSVIHYTFTRVGGYPETILAGNNVLLDLAVHDIDILRSLAGPVSVESSVCHASFKPPVLDTAEILLRAQNGPSASLHVNWITPTKIRTIRVTGTRGVCFVDYILQTCELLGGSLLKANAPEQFQWGTLQDLYKTTDRIAFGVQKEEPLQVQLQQFHQLLTAGDLGSLCSGEDAVRAVKIAEAAMKTDGSDAAREWI